MEKNATPHPLVQELQNRMYAARLKVGRVMVEAGVNPSTWSRWGRGTPPNLGTLQRVADAVNKLENSQ